MTATTTLYIGDRAYSSWSLRAWLALSHAGVAFDTELIRLDAAESAANLAAVSPSRTVPALRSGDLAVWDSLAIAEWAAEQADPGVIWPRDAGRRAVGRSVSATLHSCFSALRNDAPMNLHREGAPAELSDAALADVMDLERVWCMARDIADVSAGPFLLGAWSAADAMAAPYATRLRSYAISVSAATTAYVQAVLSDPAFLTWEAAARADPRRLADVDAI